MTLAEAAVLAMVVVLCMAIARSRGTLPPLLGSFLVTLALLAAVAVVLLRLVR